MILIIVITTNVANLHTVFANENEDYVEIQFKVDSDQVEDKIMTLYLNSNDGEYYISLDDLCELTRCKLSIDKDTIVILQGAWNPKLNIKEETFDDGVQKVDVQILRIGNGEYDYAIPALMFLTYFKASAFINEDGRKVLTCRMPSKTEWEVLDVDYGSTIANADELYGGRKNLEKSLTYDIILEWIVGDLKSSDEYLTDIYNEALSLDMEELYNGNALKNYLKKQQEFLNEDITKAQDSTEWTDFATNLKDWGAAIYDTAIDPAQWITDAYYRRKEVKFIEKYGAYNINGNFSLPNEYMEECIKLVGDDKEKMGKIENVSSIADPIVALAGLAASLAVQEAYITSTNNIVYNVMGKDNLSYLGLSADDNDWFTIANNFEDALKATTPEIKSTLFELVKDNLTDNVFWDKFVTNLTSSGTAEGISTDYAILQTSIAMGQLFAKIYPGTAGIVRQMEADRKGIYLSELQQNVCFVLKGVYDKINKDTSNQEAYDKCIEAQELYCRVSIAMYQNWQNSLELTKNDKITWKNKKKSKTEIKKEETYASLQRKIDTLTISLYELNLINGENCLPMDLKKFSSNGVNNDKAKEIYENFLTSGQYKDYTKDTELDVLEYGIYDINKDGKLELLIQSTAEAPFYTTWLFGINYADETVVSINEQYGYGEWRLSDIKNTIIGSPEVRPSKYVSYLPFYKLKGKKFEFEFEIVNDEGRWTYSDKDGNKKEIEESEVSSYTENASDIAYWPLNMFITSSADEEQLKREWKTAYTNYIEEHGNKLSNWGEEVNEYALIDVDGDEIPELYVDYVITGYGSTIITYSQNRGLAEQDMWASGLFYIPRKNLFLDYRGHMGNYSDLIYSIQDGQFVLKYTGKESEDSNNGTTTFNYNWNGEELSSEDEYEKRLAEVFDKSDALSVGDGINMCHYQEILDKINEY